MTVARPFGRDCNTFLAINFRNWLTPKPSMWIPAQNLTGHLSDFAGDLNGSTQHFLEVYSQESENLKSFVGVDLSAALLCPVPTG